MHVESVGEPAIHQLVQDKDGGMGTGKTRTTMWCWWTGAHEGRQQPSRPDFRGAHIVEDPLRNDVNVLLQGSEENGGHTMKTSQDPTHTPMAARDTTSGAGAYRILEKKVVLLNQFACVNTLSLDDTHTVDRQDLLDVGFIPHPWQHKGLEHIGTAQQQHTS